jgi:hypothetical protein
MSPINATHRRAGAGPAPLQIGGRGQVLPNSSAINSRRRLLQCRYRNNVSLRSSRTACPRRCFDTHANEQNRGPLARIAKAFRSETGTPRERRQWAEWCSRANLECGLFMRFAVTCQWQVIDSRAVTRSSVAGTILRWPPPGSDSPQIWRTTLAWLRHERGYRRRGRVDWGK